MITAMNSSWEPAVFILAGGKSTRMGADKAFVALNGRTLLARALDLGRSFTSSVYIVGNRERFSPFAPAVDDIFADCGPLGGIHAALRTSRHDLNVMLAVDLPFVSLALLQFLVTRAKNATSMVTVPRAAAGLQPLCAVYRPEFADLAETALRAGRYKIDALFDPVRTQIITEEELETAGFSGRVFRNLNTPQDVAEACG